MLFAISIGMLVVAHAVRGFTSDLLLNLGSSLILAAASYVIFDPIFEEARKSRVQEHDHFEQAVFIDRMRETDRNIRILDTWTILLEGRTRTRTFDAMQEAIGNGATIRVLLLDPDSAAAQQRAEELERRQIDVAAQIMANLRELHLFRDQLDGRAQRAQLRVCVYDASPSIQLYQWDGRALISFFPIGKMSFDVPQLEVDMASPWGQFVDRRFDELWDHHDHIRTLDQYWRLGLTLIDGERPLDAVTVPYISAQEHIYVDGTGTLSRRLAERVLHASGGPATGTGSFGAMVAWPSRGAGQQARACDLIPVSGEQSPGPTEILGLFGRKYGGYAEIDQGEALLLRLAPR